MRLQIRGQRNQHLRKTKEIDISQNASTATCILWLLLNNLAWDYKGWTKRSKYL